MAKMPGRVCGSMWMRLNRAIVPASGGESSGRSLRDAQLRDRVEDSASAVAALVRDVGERNGAGHGVEPEHATCEGLGGLVGPVAAVELGQDGPCAGGLGPQGHV